MSNASRLTKWRSRSVIWAAQISPPVQRRTASPGGRTAKLPQTGQCSGKTYGSVPAGRRSARTSTTCGMTSPARWISTVSPTRMSLASMKSWLCKVARATTTPPTVTGSSSATGVSAPVLPTWTEMSLTLVSACSAANLWAIAQRGARPAKPSRRW